MTRQNTHQILIIGAGISGLVLAERYASLGKRVLVVEKRRHIGGNCYDYKNKAGLLTSKYGPHIFHTNYEDVWMYVQKFAQWRPYTHRVRAWVDGQLVPVPVNIETVNQIFGLKIKSEAEMLAWLEANQAKIDRPRNSEEVALSRVGPVLYEKIFKNYTIKQWNKHPSQLSPTIVSRIPVRTTAEDHFFSDKYQSQPVGGFTQLFKKMIQSDKIEIRLGVDFLAERAQFDLPEYEKVFYTGPVDRFFDCCYGKGGLEYRSLKFKFETHPQEFYQKYAVVNYPNDHEFTRIVEYKHITGQKHAQTVISKEFPTNRGEPYYPVLTRENRLLHNRYKKLVKQLGNIYFIGRLAEYRYINMDEAFHNALNLFARLESK